MQYGGNRPGFLLIEALIGIVVFGIFVSAISFTLLYGQESTIIAGDRIRATQYSERALEATRSLRDSSFSSVTAGQHGIWVAPASGIWAFSGSSVTSNNEYHTHVYVTQLASDHLELGARTSWKRGYNRSGSVLLTSEITDWRSTVSIGNWSSIALDGSVTPGGTPQFTDIAVFSGSYAFVSAANTTGLYIFDIRNTSSPSRVNTSFALGTNAYDVEISGSHLYVATGDSTQDIRVYNIANPIAFTSAQLLTSYDVPGSARVRALAASGNRLYAGTTASSTSGQDEFYTFAVNGSGALTLLDTLNDNSSTYEMIALVGTAAYLSSSYDSGELQVVNVTSGSNISYKGIYNLSDRTSDGQSIAISGTSALIGTTKSASLQEVVLLDLENADVPAPPPGPWYHEGSGSVVGLAIDPSRCYGFIAALSGKKAFQVFNIRNKSTLAELTTYNSSTGLGRGVLYDPTKDRVYVITDQAFLIFRPGTYTGTCP